MVAGWNWTLVGEMGCGIAIGIAAGGWFVVDRLEIAMLRIAGHPSVRKLANAADKFSGQAGADGGWPGLIGNGLNFLTGGKFLANQGAQAGRIMVVNEQGEQVGWADAVKR